LYQKGLNLLLYQEEDGFLFNSDSHYLYDFISKLNPRGELLDVGCGCGILGLLIARDFQVNLTSIDIQPNNILLTKSSAKANSILCQTIIGDFLKVELANKFDFIISNPPYYSSSVIESKNSKLSISRYAKYLNLEEFIKKSKKLLTNRGNLVFCYDAKEIDTIFQISKECKLQIENIRFIYGTLNKSSSLVFIHARDSSKSKVNVLPPLIATHNGEFSDDVKSIYQKTRTYSIKCKV
jgi:tRNA1(Val) A37 N6-methylase TrmN6